MMKVCSVWSVRYFVNTDDFMNPLPEGWSIWYIVWSVVLGEREEDSCLVINLSGKVVEYNLISKTLQEIYDIGSNQLDDDELIPPFAADHNIYEFIPSFASFSSEMQESGKKQGKKDLENIMDEVDIEDLTIEYKSTPTHDQILELAHYLGPNQPDAESDCDLEDMEEEVIFDEEKLGSS
ncbi:hypothetical protein Tco_0672397 [Tanacetum coccineum]